MSHFHKLGNLGKSVWLYRLFQAPPELEHTGGGSCCARHTPLQSEPGTETRGVLTFQTRDAGRALEEASLGLQALAWFVAFRIRQESLWVPGPYAQPHWPADRLKGCSQNLVFSVTLGDQDIVHIGLK